MILFPGSQVCLGALSGLGNDTEMAVLCLVLLLCLLLAACALIRHFAHRFKTELVPMVWSDETFQAHRGQIFTCKLLRSQMLDGQQPAAANNSQKRVSVHRRF